MEKEEKILGFMSLNYPILDMDRLKWLEEWLFESAEGVLGFDNRTFEVTFFRERYYIETCKFFMYPKQETGWQVKEGDMNILTLFAPNGVTVKLLFDHEGGPNQF